MDPQLLMLLFSKLSPRSRAASAGVSSNDDPQLALALRDSPPPKLDADEPNDLLLFAWGMGGAERLDLLEDLPDPISLKDPVLLVLGGLEVLETLDPSAMEVSGLLPLRESNDSELPLRRCPKRLELSPRLLLFLDG